MLLPLPQLLLFGLELVSRGLMLLMLLVSLFDFCCCLLYVALFALFLLFCFSACNVLC